VFVDCSRGAKANSVHSPETVDETSVGRDKGEHKWQGSRAGARESAIFIAQVVF
jgi:hypothetical protein